METRRPIFPHVIELNFQARRLLGCNVYLIFDADTNDWVLIDIGYEDTVDDFIELIRELDFPFSQCQGLLATHADVDHIQGLSTAKSLIKTTVAAHPLAAEALKTGDRIMTFAEITPQNISLDMPPVEVDRMLNEGDQVQVGSLTLEVWHTPGHTNSQLSFRLGELLFSADNIYRDGCVGAIDAHHGSDIKAFLRSLRRIRDSDVRWLAPSHGPIFAKDSVMLDKVIARVETYLHMADFGTLADNWPLMDQWDEEVAQGILPDGLEPPR
jgi:glyoxylase-like metal-dependent hydrolase (beta-lactamase superfamily II)